MAPYFGEHTSGSFLHGLHLPQLVPQHIIQQWVTSVQTTCDKCQDDSLSRVRSLVHQQHISSLNLIKWHAFCQPQSHRTQNKKYLQYSSGDYQSRRWERRNFHTNCEPIHGCIDGKPKHEKLCCSGEIHEFQRTRTKSITRINTAPKW